MNTDKIKGLIGLSRRAGQLSLGSDTVLRQLRSGAAGVVLMDTAAAANTSKRLVSAAQAADIPLYTLPEGLLDLATGESGRISAAVQKGSLAEQIKRLLADEAEK